MLQETNSCEKSITYCLKGSGGLRSIQSLLEPPAPFGMSYAEVRRELFYNHFGRRYRLV